MCSNELVLAVTGIGIGLAEGKTNEEIALLSAVFMQLADVLGVIAANNEYNDSICPKDKEKGSD